MSQRQSSSSFFSGAFVRSISVLNYDFFFLIFLIFSVVCSFVHPLAFWFFCVFYSFVFFVSFCRSVFCFFSVFGSLSSVSLSQSVWMSKLTIHNMSHRISNGFVWFVCFLPSSFHFSFSSFITVFVQERNGITHTNGSKGGLV